MVPSACQPLHQIKKLVVSQQHLKLNNVSFRMLVEFHVDTLPLNHTFGVPLKCANITDVLGTTLIFIDNQLSHVKPGASFFGLRCRFLHKSTSVIGLVKMKIKWIIKGVFLG